VERIQSALVRFVTSAPTMNANGIEKPTYPAYRHGGWNIIAGWRSSGLSPFPSTGVWLSCANGFCPLSTISPRKKTAIPPSTAFAYGAMSRWRRRVAKRATLDITESRKTHRSREPSWLDHIAVSL
jgi:hypothetical protein